MAANDIYLIDGVVEQRARDRVPSERKDEVFERLVFESLLKDYDPSEDDIEAGTVDGEDDGGLDGFFIIANGQLVSELSEFVPPRRGGELDVLAINCKHHDTFKQSTLDKLTATCQEFFDFSRDGSDLKARLSARILKIRVLLKDVYKLMAPGLASLRIRIIYASRGDTTRIGLPVEARARQIESILADMFSQCTARCEFMGAAELVRLQMRIPKFNLELPYKDRLSKGACYAVLVELRDYAKFLSEDDGTLKRYLFDANVRDFAGLNRVNQDIADTLASESPWDFWWLNNGVTILASRALLTRDSIHVDDVQVVNGLQTSESIHRYFQNGGADPTGRTLLVKVIETEDLTVRDEVIRATNNQTEVQQASLWATDETQRHIEQALERSGYFYDRRKGYHANHGRPESRIVPVLEAAAAHIALILKGPQKASSLRQKHLRAPDRYAKVFSPGFPLEAWVPMIDILRNAGRALERRRRSGAFTGTTRFLKHWRPMLALCATARIAGTFRFTPIWLAAADLSSLSESYLDEVWAFLEEKIPPKFRVGATKPSRSLVRDIAHAVAENWNIEGAECVEDGPPLDDLRPEVSESLLSRVDRLLPEQPWPVGVHKTVAHKLGASHSDVSNAIAELMDRGTRFKQVDGIVYDAEGNEILRDHNRHGRIDADELLETQ